MDIDLMGPSITRRHQGRQRLAAAAWLLAVGTPAATRAQDAPEDGDFDLASLAEPGVYLPMGASLGGAYRHDAPDGLMLGAEVSLVSFGQVGPPGSWFGGYADGCWDFGVDAFRHSTGPQFGIAMLGLDVGYLGELRDGTYRPGLSARGFVTLGVLSMFGRYGRLYGRGAVADEDVAEFGVLVKVPLRLSGSGGTGRADASKSANDAGMLRFQGQDPW